ncbi:MAG: penicillin acylase family protein [Deltaproteobacteria bacterium]|nr:penicillin acylase family protein [Deltaproteobacteria bacterium]
MKENVHIFRDENGIPHVEAENRRDLYWGQGYVHGRDRGMQVLLMRILGQGRACELLDSSDDTLAIDQFFRRMNWAGHTRAQEEALSDQGREYVAQYADGVTTALSDRCPWELRLLRYKPEPWSIHDTIMMSRMLGYLTLSQSQAEMERLFVEMVQAGIDRDRLEELFPGLLEGLDMDLVKKISLQERIVPAEALWNVAAPRMMASNNWVLSGGKTASGKPMVSNDPHLEVNRLPNVLSEIVLKVKDRYAMGGSLPGLPGILTGRTSDIAWGVTYAFMDTVDSWIEQCRDGKFYLEEGNKWVTFHERKETIKRKGKSPVETTFYENNHGVLDGDPYREGYYLATRWSADHSGALSLDNLLKMWEVQTAEEAMDTLGRAETAWSFVLADKSGDIGFQMSGLLPKRRKGVSGFAPLPGWDRANDWQGFVDHQDLPRSFNPEQGYFATANHDLNAYGKVSPINMPMGHYRAERICRILEKGEGFTAEDMFRMHFDVYSTQAESFMKILKPLLPDTDQGKILAKWDLCYDKDSRGAFLFEAFYRELYCEVFGRKGFGETICDHLEKETSTFVDFYLNFDRILLSETSAWFGEETREALYARVAARALDVPAQAWGDVRKFTMSHILFGGKLPSFLGFDRGPITGIGNRATIHQGQIYRSANRTTTFFPCFRIVSDLSTDECRTNLAGGPSDRRFSKWYISDLDNWLKGRYKTVSPHDAQAKLPFK